MPCLVACSSGQQAHRWLGAYAGGARQAGAVAGGDDRGFQVARGKGTTALLTGRPWRRRPGAVVQEAEPVALRRPRRSRRARMASSRTCPCVSISRRASVGGGGSAASVRGRGVHQVADAVDVDDAASSAELVDPAGELGDHARAGRSIRLPRRCWARPAMRMLGLLAMGATRILSGVRAETTCDGTAMGIGNHATCLSRPPGAGIAWRAAVAACETWGWAAGSVRSVGGTGCGRRPPWSRRQQSALGRLWHAGGTGSIAAAPHNRVNWQPVRSAGVSTGVGQHAATLSRRRTGASDIRSRWRIRTSCVLVSIPCKEVWTLAAADD